jgi:hypothetical protein
VILPPLVFPGLSLLIFFFSEKTWTKLMEPPMELLLELLLCHSWSTFSILIEASFAALLGAPFIAPSDANLGATSMVSLGVP